MALSGLSVRDLPFEETCSEAWCAAYPGWVALDGSDAATSARLGTFAPLAFDERAPLLAAALAAVAEGVVSESHIIAPEIANCRPPGAVASVAPAPRPVLAECTARESFASRGSAAALALCTTS